MTNHLPPSGWYVDPQNTSRLRWWDGTAWTEHFQASSPPVTIPTAASTPDSTPVDQRSTQYGNITYNHPYSNGTDFSQANDIQSRYHLTASNHVSPLAEPIHSAHVPASAQPGTSQHASVEAPPHAFEGAHDPSALDQEAYGFTGSSFRMARFSYEENRHLVKQEKIARSARLSSIISIFFNPLFLFSILAIAYGQSVISQTRHAPHSQAHAKAVSARTLGIITLIIGVLLVGYAVFRQWPEITAAV